MKPKLDMLASYKEEIDLMEGCIQGLFNGNAELQILEAGCGPSWPLRLRGMRYRLTGVDLDREALERRKNVAKDLHEAVVGDLRHMDFESGKFDVIYNAFVLEHVENASLLLENFARWLKPGGLLILLLPDRDSVFGFITRMTPLWFHVLYHRYVLGHRNAGRAGFGPYATHYDQVVSRKGIRDFCQAHRFTMREERGMCTYALDDKPRKRLVRAVAIAASALSLGKLPWTHDNLTYVLEKQQPD